MDNLHSTRQNSETQDSPGMHSPPLAQLCSTKEKKGKTCKKGWEIHIKTLPVGKQVDSSQTVPGSQKRAVVSSQGDPSIISVMRTMPYSADV